MEQLQLTATKDNENLYRILGDLMDTEREFQIMITVPAGKTGDLKSCLLYTSPSPRDCS